MHLTGPLGGQRRTSPSSAPLPFEEFLEHPHSWVLVSHLKGFFFPSTHFWVWQDGPASKDADWQALTI